MKITLSEKTEKKSVFWQIEDLKFLLFLALTNWLAHFWYFRSFGIYEDDHFRIPEAMGMTLMELYNYVSSLLFNLGHTQGRPLHIIFIYIFSFLGAKLGGLGAVYWIAYLLTTINIILFYLLLKRIDDSVIFPLTGALAFTLFTADTTRIWLTSVFGLQTTLTFLLLAFNLYISNQKIISYFIIFLSLVTYETAFFIFLTAPLLAKKLKSKTVTKLLQHGLIMLAIFMVVVLLRKISGEYRATELDLLTAIQTSLLQMLIGSLVSLKSYFISPGKTILVIFKEDLLIFLVFYLVASLILLRKLTSQKNPQFWHQSLKLIVIGSLMLILAYPLTFTVSATQINGPWSRVHMAGAIGASILCGSLGSIIFYFGSFYKQQSLAVLGISLFFTLLVGYGIIIQKDYQTNWQYQKDFWREMIPLISDVGDENLVLVESKGIHTATQQMRANDWNTPPVLGNIYKFPQSWQYPPKVYMLTSNWEENIVAGKDLFLLNTSTLAAAGDHLPVPNTDSTIESSKVILIKSREGHLVRAKSPLVIEGKSFNLKENIAANGQFLPKGSLFEVIKVKKP